MTLVTNIEFTQVFKEIKSESITEKTIKAYKEKVTEALKSICNADDIQITNVQLFPTEER